ncbi:hypothetical protein GCM10022254_20380 [Actinomadura meridiana]|uniref:Carrier domain-containing protein n=1 Tax=Actinomadura meridiana TaxID=559626 RepID=A0ABP8BX16_9ACTN
MSIEGTDTDLWNEIREIVADVVEVDPDEIGPTTRFWEDLDADSLQAIEILSALERRFRITIDQKLLVDMRDVQSTYRVVVRAREVMTGDGA